MAASLIAALLLPSAAIAQSDWGGTTARLGAQSYDLFLLRPLQIGATVVGSAFFVPAAFLSAFGGEEGVIQAWDLFVRAPWEAAFQRPLGDF